MLLILLLGKTEFYLQDYILQESSSSPITILPHCVKLHQMNS